MQNSSFNFVTHIVRNENLVMINCLLIKTFFHHENERLNLMANLEMGTCCSQMFVADELD
jgi:hypothetical protein